MKVESVKSTNPYQSVIQTNDDIVKAHGGELSVRTPSEKVETLPAEAAAKAGKEGEGSTFIITLPITTS